METNSGIAVLESLLTNTNVPTTAQYGDGSYVAANTTPTPYDITNALIGIGDGGGTVPAPQATDYELVGNPNDWYMGMDPTFPQVSGGVMTWQGTVGPNTANFAWNEWGLFNGRGKSNHGIMFNHKGVALGTKASGSTWVFQAQITQS